MCALFGSPDRKLFNELAKLNSYRGNHSYSVATTNWNGVSLVTKALGKFEMPNVIAPYYIGHTQAPTTEAKSIESVHPSEIEGTFLWHNGIIFDSYVKQLQSKLQTSDPWDTKLLHALIHTNQTSVLSEVKGSFACVWFDGNDILLFRNANCPLFTDGSSYSSTKFSGSEEIEAETFYNLNKKGITKTDVSFKTAQEFYWSAE